MERQYALDHAVFETVTGSQAYGTSTPESDTDKAGVMIPGPEYFYGLKRVSEFRDFGGEDRVLHELRRFLALVLENNPNIMDIMWAPDRCVLLTTPYWEQIAAVRDSFLSKKCRYTYSGYAIAQLHRIKTHRKYLLDPPKSVPSRTEMGLPETPMFPTSQLKAVCYASIKALPDDSKAEFLDELDKIYADWVIPLLARFLDPSERRLSMEWLQLGIKAQAHAFQALGTKYLKDEYYEMAAKEVAYLNRKTEWEQYEQWNKTRNRKRADLEKKFGFDCYMGDTEFLTKNGWKRYDEVTGQDLLGTLNQQSGCIEFQAYTDRVSKEYSGPMVVVTPRHSNCAVTLNHRMWVSPAHRSQTNGYSWGYTSEDAEWGIHPLQDLVDGRRSYFHVRLAGEPTNKAYPVDPNFLMLMGAYVSEGSVGKRLQDGSASVLRISQKAGNRLCECMGNLQKTLPTHIRNYESLRDDEWRREPCLERIWTVSHREWAQKLSTECGFSSLDKRLPGWTKELSVAQAKTLLEVMLAGDGTPHGEGWVYYTASKQLADDIQAMCVCCGIVSAIWGPYINEGHADMYQVFIGNRTPFATAVLCPNDTHTCTHQEVTNTRIVCFTVPNETLVTRRNGKIAIHGNTKHAMHLVRLLRQGSEILSTGKVNVDRTGIDAEELKEIRNGSWPYEKIEQYASDMDKDMARLYETSKLRRSPDAEAAQVVCQQVVTSYLRDKHGQ